MSKQSKWMMGCGTLAVVNVVSILFVLGLIFGAETAQITESQITV